MEGIDRAWAIEQLGSFILHAERVASTTPGVMGTSIEGREEDIAGQAQVLEQIPDRSTPRWRDQVGEHNRKWQDLRLAASLRHAQLERDQELREKLGKNPPELCTAEFHAWIWNGAKSLGQSGHSCEAVEGGIKKFNAETQDKIGRRDVSETDPFKQLFSMDEPKRGKASLRRVKDDPSDTYKSAQCGAMRFVEDVFAGIRNLLSHETGEELTEQEALEYLAANSVLACGVGDSNIEEPS